LVLGGRAAATGCYQRAATARVMQAASAPREAYVTLSKGHESSADEPLVNVVLLCDQVLADDYDAAIILVFPRGQDSGGEVDPNKEIEHPYEEATKIFIRPHGHEENSRNLSTEFDELKRGPMLMKQYQEFVRNHLKKLLQRAGFKASTIESIDGDEVFLKLGLDRNGDMIRKLAERYNYMMPFNDKAYEHEERSGNVEKGKPLKNNRGYYVRAYEEYQQGLDDKFEPFREVDEIRLMEKRIDEWVSLPAMLEQGIISRYFPGPNHKEMAKFEELWANPFRVFHLPTHHHDDEIRNYFGEEIAFFFRWFCFYLKMLVPLAVAGTIFLFMNVLSVSHDNKRRLMNWYAALMVLWASIFNEVFKNNAARLKQRWGMKDVDTLAVELSSYRPELEGTYEGMIRKHIGFAGACIYLLIFVAFIGCLTKAARDSADDGNTSMASKFPLILSIVIKVLSFLWAKIAYILNRMQNHRFEGRSNDALTGILFSVKIFVAVWPFLDTAFVQLFIANGLHCGKNLANAAIDLYDGEKNWPNTGHPLDFSRADSIPNDDKSLAFLDGMWHYRHNRQGGVCIMGCYPVNCFTEDGKTFCETNCWMELQANLQTFYLFQLGLSLLLRLLVPMLLTRYQVWEEMRRARKMGSQDTEYSMLQLQAKRHAVVPYEYDSWGGSYVEDFLDLAIGFALLTFFGQVKPWIALLGFVCHMIEYRLLAYRMTHVTCRPMPRGSEGIGCWQSVFETISQCAITINVGLGVFVMDPIASKSFGEKLIYFIVAQNGLSALRAFVGIMIPDEPEDVVRIEDENNLFRQRTLKRPKVEVSKEETQSYEGLDIGLDSSKGLRSRSRSSFCSGEDDDTDGSSDG